MTENHDAHNRQQRRYGEAAAKKPADASVPACHAGILAACASARVR